MVSDKGRPQKPDDLLEWFTVSYRTIFIVAGVVIALAAAGGYVYYRGHAPPPPAPPPPSTSTSARFNIIEGSVQVRFAGTLQWVSAGKNTILNKNDLVRTGPGAAAEIRFFDGTIFHVRPDSLITIEEASEDPVSKRRQVGASIGSGEVNFTAVSANVPGSKTRISTPTVDTITQGNAEGNIQVQESGQTTARMFQGTAVAQTRTGERIELNRNEGLVVDAAGKPSQKMVLPSVPTLLAPPHQAEIAYPDIARATTLLAWQTVLGASAYHVMLDYSPTFARPVVDRKDWKKGNYELNGLEVGTYFWRVSAVDKDGGEGNFSDSSRFTVTKSATGPPPPLVIETLEPRGNVLQVKGRTEPGASLTVNGQRVDVQADGSFNEFITFESGKQTVVIRATGVGGGVSELKRPVVVPE